VPADWADLAVQGLAEGVVIAVDGRTVYANRTAERLLAGRRPGGLAGRLLLDLFDPEWRLWAAARAADPWPAQGAPATPARLQTSDGEAAEYEVVLGALPAAAGAVQLVVYDTGSRPWTARLEQARQQVHDAVWRMRRQEDVWTVLQVLERQLRALEVPYEHLAVNAVDDTTDPPVVSILQRPPGSSPGDAAAQPAVRWVRPHGPGPGLIADFWRAGRIAYRPDLASDDPYGEYQRVRRRYPAVRALVDIPFSHGTLALNSSVPHALAPHHLAALSELAEVLSEGFRRQDDLRALARQTQEAELLADIVATVAASADIERALHNVVDGASRLMQAELVILFLFDEGQGVLAPRAQVGFDWEAFQRLRLAPGEDTSGRVFVTGEAALFEAAAGPPEGLAPEQRCHFCRADGAPIPARRGAVVPLRLADKVIGTLSAASFTRRFAQRDLALLTRLAEHATVALERLTHLQQMEATLATLQETAAALHESERTARALLNTPMLRVALVDRDGRVVDANAPMAQGLGTRVSELVGSLLFDRQPTELWARRRAAFGAAVRTGRQARFEDEREGRWFDTVLDPVSDGEGRVNRVAIVVRDITDERRLQQGLVRTQRLRVAGELSAGISHNLNNILTGVLLPAQLLLQLDTNEERRGLLADILRAGERARELVHRLHLSVRVNSTEPLTPVPLAPTVAEVVNATRPRWKDQLEALGVEVKVVTAIGDLPPLRGTRSELHDLLTNLMLNAIDALPHGGTIRIEAEARDGAVCLVFSDDGTGMDEATQARVFEPFFTTKMTVGTGLGLSTAHNSVTRWGGRAEVSSQPGKGTKFTFTLPLWDAAGTEPAQAGVLPAAAVGRGRVLVVDDDATVARMLGAVLSRDHQVDVETSPLAALGRYQTNQYDVVLVDLGMAELAGDAMATQLRRLDPQVALVLVTGWDLDDEDPRRETFDLVLRKPFTDVAEVLRAVNNAAALHQQRATGS
jgi:PAS domain S-box-containing protein